MDRQAVSESPGIAKSVSDGGAQHSKYPPGELVSIGFYKLLD